MFIPFYKGYRKSTIFEKLLLIVGVSVGIIGFWLINKLYQQDLIISWQLLMSVFLWFLLIFIIILTASNEGIKEELSIIIKQHIEETKLIKEEIKLLNANLTKNRKK